MRRLISVYEFECDYCHKKVLSRSGEITNIETGERWHELHSRLPGKSDQKHFCSEEHRTAAGFIEDKK